MKTELLNLSELVTLKTKLEKADSEAIELAINEIERLGKVIDNYELYEQPQQQSTETAFAIHGVSGSASENSSFCPECGKSSCNGNCY
jgi:hypothetical protein